MRKIFCLIFLVIASSLHSYEDSSDCSDTEDNVESEEESGTVHEIKKEDCEIFTEGMRLCAWQAILNNDLGLLHKIVKTDLLEDQKDSQSFIKIRNLLY